MLTRFVAFALLVISQSLPSTCVGSELPEGPDIWSRTKRAAENSGDPKSLWRELKKLEPSALLLCGEQFCQAMEKKESVDITSLIVTVNAILSYHKDKTSYEATARAVGRAIAVSDSPLWVYAAMEWIENNDHYKSIPKPGMKAIAEGIRESLENDKRRPEIQVRVLQKAASEDILSNLAPEDIESIAVNSRTIAERCENGSVVSQARKTLGFLERRKGVNRESASEK